MWESLWGGSKGIKMIIIAFLELLQRLARKYLWCFSGIPLFTGHFSLVRYLKLLNFFFCLKSGALETSIVKMASSIFINTH